MGILPDFTTVTQQRRARQRDGLVAGNETQREKYEAEREEAERRLAWFKEQYRPPARLVPDPKRRGFDVTRKPLPTRCRRCRGWLLAEEDELRCLQCGDVNAYLVPTPAVSPAMAARVRAARREEFQSRLRRIANRLWDAAFDLGQPASAQAIARRAGYKGSSTHVLGALRRLVKDGDLTRDADGNYAIAGWRGRGR